MKTKKVANHCLQPHRNPIRWRREREMNLQFKSIYIKILRISPNQNTPNRPQPICFVLPCVALGQYKDTNFVAKIKFAFTSKAYAIKLILIILFHYTTTNLWLSRDISALDDWAYRDTAL